MMQQYRAKALMISSSRIRRCCTETGGEAARGFVVTVRSESMIKPSSPTPPHLRRFKLSLFDLITPPEYYATFVSFYRAPPAAASQHRHHVVLRDSLSKALSHFYPLAGRLELVWGPDGGWGPTPSSFVNCNDEGVLYVEAEADQDMAEFLGDTVPVSEAQLLSQQLGPPRPRVVCPRSSSSQVVYLAAVKTTVFRCGGIAVGVSVSHVVADAQVTGMLLKKWAAFAVGGTTTTADRGYAHDAAASLFQAEESIISGTRSYMRELSEKAAANRLGAVANQRFVFTREAISALKTEARSEQVPDPSRTAAISGLIWKAANDASRETAGAAAATSVLLSVVNLRPRLKVPLQDYPMGNVLWVAAAAATLHIDGNGDDRQVLKQLVKLVKGSVAEVDGDFVEKLQGGTKAHHELQKLLIASWSSNSSINSSTRQYNLSSILRNGMNEVDFGWGKPLWVRFLWLTDEPPGRDNVVLMEATAGDDGAVEALVSLDEREMAIFQQDPHLLRYAVLNPRIRL
ncbi:unnamed protein product [Linum tenue]|uniref:Uncharacterized protein n=1 Tax=Linum tenue TaxID=586396 RepID=A0AAV0M685_9ROSI|nr:unnamed protein product [Linum tenue]